MRENLYFSELSKLRTTAKKSSHKRFKRKLSAFLVAAVLLTIPNLIFAQAPNLGTAANFVLFTGVGAVTHSGSSHITGNVGSNSGSSTGFGNVNGVMLNNNGATATCAADLLTAYHQLNIAIPTATPSSLLGNGTTLVAGVYHITSAATLNLALNLDGQGNPNALFIFQIDGSLSANSLSRVNLLNGALACNVFWKVEGLVSIATASTMRGNIIANNAAINIGTGDTLEGRALSTAGAISVSGVVAYTPIGCGSTYLTGPAAPALASTAAYGVFSGNGQVTNTGVTHITGDVGSNLGLTTGFNPLFVTGTIHPIPDASTAACAADLTNVYNYLNTIPYDIELLYPAQFGNDLTLTPHTYLMNAATTFTGAVYLDAEGDANAVFIIKINGALTSGTFSRVVLINGTQAKNVYWKIDGAVNIAGNSLFNGTMVANNGAIQLGLNDTINGRALTTDGAVTIQSSNITITTAACTAPPITGNNNVCPNSTTVLSNTTTGGRWSSSNPLIATIDSISGTVRGINAGNTTITYVTPTSCVSTTGFIVNPNPAPITGPGFVCSGSTITLNDITPNGTWSSSNILQATVVSTTGVVTGVSTGTPFITYTLTATGCVANKTISVNANGGTITGSPSVCAGTTTQLTDSIPGGTWSASNNKATVINGLVTGITTGIDTITYSVTNTCGTAATTKIITINTVPTAGTIIGPNSVCIGSTITLTDAITGGIWSASNTNATVVNGFVTGIAAGTDNIMYSVTNVCGTAIATHAMTINLLPNAGSISGPSSVCVGSSITLTDATTGGIWSASNTNATVLNGVVSGVIAGTDNIIYSVTNVCGTATATQTITINPLPNAGTITGPTGVCYGTTITLTDAATGGTWSTSNNNASVTGGTVTANATGQDTIYYTVVNVCGTAITSHDITVNPLPVVPAITTQAPANVCKDTKYQNFGTATPPATGTTYSWTATNAKVWAQGLNRQYSLVTFDTTGNAYVMLHSTLTGTGCTNEKTIPITVGTSIAEIPSVVYFNYHFVCTPNNENSYQWGYDDAITLDSTILTGEINQDYLNANADFANKYYWVMTNIGGCLQKTYYTIPTGVQNVNSAAGLSVYPNPTSSVVNVVISSAINGEMQVEIMNMTGQMLSMTTATNNKASVNVEMLPAGSYLITCYRDGIKIAISKFTKN